MNARTQEKFGSYFQEFPWLSSGLKTNRIRKIEVSRLETETMQKNAPDFFAEDSLLLLDEHGSVITEVGKRNYGWRPFLGLVRRKERETISEAVMRIGFEVSERAVYVLKIEHLTREDGWLFAEVTVYKMPKAFPTMNKWIAELRRRADHALAQKIAAIDTEGEQAA